LLTTDLAQTDRLRVLERSQVQVLTDEMALVRENFVDPATAARTGRMLRSAHIVQGRIDGSQSDLTVQAQVVATESPRDTASGPIRQGGGIARLFDMEKQIALGVYNRLGIQLTVAERQRVDRRATANVQALIAFGFGLESRDAGNYAEAVRQFTRATQFDPGFDQARALRDEAERRSRTPAATQEMARAAASSFDVTLTAWQRARLGIEALESAIPNPQVRDPIVEVLGTEGLGRGTGIDLIIRRPVGGS
jgi:hypothetical protein